MSRSAISESGILWIVLAFAALIGHYTLEWQSFGPGPIRRADEAEFETVATCVSNSRAIQWVESETGSLPRLPETIAAGRAAAG